MMIPGLRLVNCHFQYATVVIFYSDFGFWRLQIQNPEFGERAQQNSINRCRFKAAGAFWTATGV